LFVTHDIEEAIFLGDVIYVMTSRPGRIRTTLKVDIPRPRTFGTLTGPRFTELRNQIVAIIHEESLKAVESELVRACRRSAGATAALPAHRCDAGPEIHGHRDLHASAQRHRHGRRGR